MAELLGVVASAITVAEVAAKAGGAIPKLKKLWDEVQNVPETIQDLLRQIEILDPMIWEMENELNTYRTSIINPMLFDDTAMRRSTHYSRESLQNLSNIVDDMSIQIQHQKKVWRGLARAKVVLKKQVLADLEARLRKALTLLSLAQQSYMMSMMKLQPLIIVNHLKTQDQRPGQTLVAIELPTDDNWSSDEEEVSDADRNMPRGTSRQVTKQEWTHSSWVQRFGFATVTWQMSERKLLGGHRTSHSFRIQLPSWLLNTSWEFQLSRGLGGPSFGLRAWRTVPWDSPAFEAVENGDITALIRSIETGQSTIFDRTVTGRTLLHLAVSEWKYPTTTLDRNQISAWHEIFIPADAYDDESISSYFGYVAVALNNRSEETLELLLRHDINDAVFDIMEIHLFVSSLGTGTVVVPAGAYAFAFGNEKARKHMLRDGVVGDLAFMMGYRSWPIPKSEAASWRAVLEAVLGDEDFDQAWLHSSTSLSVMGCILDFDYDNDIHWTWENATPLVFLLQGYCVWHDLLRGKFKHDGLTSILNFWLQILQQNGVDLVNYGRQECQLIQQSQPQLGAYWADSITYGVPERLLDIHYGPDPQDWHLVWDLDVEQMAGEFWTSMQEPEFAMPGQWVDD
ncbi:hypothetical protein E8E14_004688 [Neopestalotiopsis sp. 37M]|nr:hypothetical protein E8E14_004688 [Neopestalotiopsis sp. 37M]